MENICGSQANPSRKLLFSLLILAQFERFLNWDFFLIHSTLIKFLFFLYLEENNGIFQNIEVSS